MNSFINEQGKRSWCRTDEIDRILDSFNILNGYTDEIDTLIKDSLKEVGFNDVGNESFIKYDNTSNDVYNTLVLVFKTQGKWVVRVRSRQVLKYKDSEETILIPRALWGDIRMAWNRFQKMELLNVSL